MQDDLRLLSVPLGESRQYEECAHFPRWALEEVGELHSLFRVWVFLTGVFCFLKSLSKRVSINPSHS